MASLRAVIYFLGATAAISLALLVVAAVGLTGDLRTLVTWIFWVSFIALLVALFVQNRNAPGAEEVEVEGPGFARFLFNNRRAGLFWLPIRLFAGYAWLDAGLHKFGDPGWMQGGASILGYWQRAVAIPDAPARPSITYDWYRDFLNLLINNHAEGWFALLVTLGEIAVGVGLILGALTGIAAFFGALMNVSYLLAGSTSSNPVLFTFAIGLILAWKVAGYYGLDRYLLPRLGTPWQPGNLFRRGQGTGAPAPGSGSTS
jgi:thiosulfate dehydrogenase [quinone] large subunit